jgi:uncharacterized alpha-E superfamily protein
MKKMLSRVAESLYWMNRNIERAGNIARFIDVNFRLMLDLPAGTDVQWDALVRITGDYPTFINRYHEATRDTVIQFLSFDRENGNSIVSCIRTARENARTVREIISSEMGEQLNQLYIAVTEAANRRVDSPEEFLAGIGLATQLYTGLTHTTMSHGQAWHFARLGRMIERADQTSRIIDLKYFILLPSVDDVGSPFDEIQWNAVLGSASALEAYRQKHGRVSPNCVVELLVLDREFPRSIHFCLAQANQSLHATSRTPSDTFSNAAEHRLGQLRSEVAYTRVADIMTGGLHEYLDAFQAKLAVVDRAIHETFFEPAEGWGLTHYQSQGQGW